MSTPHTCPRCDGERKVHDARSGGAKDCPTCEGTGVVWKSDTPQEAAVGGDGPHEITGL